MVHPGNTKISQVNYTSRYWTMGSINWTGGRLIIKNKRIDQVQQQVPWYNDK